MTTPFTYHICWTNNNLHYYGSKSSKGCCPSDLWTKYFTSSDRVKELRESLGEPDVIEVRKTFDNIDQTRVWESRVLKKLNVIYRKDWLNEACWPVINNKQEKHYMWGKHIDDKTKTKISQSLKGNTNASGNKGQKRGPRTTEWKEKHSTFMKNYWQTKKQH